MDTVSKLLADVKALVARARELNKDGTDTRSRQLSLAITKLEEAGMWLQDDFERIPF